MIVYRHIRLDKNEPFYIGIGKSIKRAYSKHSRNKHWYNIVNITDYEVEILFDDLTWKEACDKEIEFIKLYGRKDLGLGPLVNMTDGGDGTLGGNGRKNYKHSQNAKNKISKSNKGKSKTTEHKEKLRNAQTGKKATNEAKRKMSESAKGRIFSEEHRRKIAEANKKRKGIKLKKRNEKEK